MTRGAPTGEDAVAVWRFDPDENVTVVEFHGSESEEKPQFAITTTLRRRRESSYSTTVPHTVLDAANVPVEQDVTVNWSINSDTGDVEVRFYPAEEE